MLCVLILYINGGTYSLKSLPNDRSFKKLFMAILFTLRVFARNLLRGNRRRNKFRILFRCLAWGSTPGFLSNKPTHYLQNHGDFAYKENPKAYIENPMHPKRVIIWCGFWSRVIIGPFFFENEQREAVTVNGDRYRAMFNEFLFTKIEEEDIGNILF